VDRRREIVMPPVDPATFRSLLGSFASGVTVVTVRDRAGRLAGMTATSVASVSLVPPLVLVCVGHEATFFGPMRRATQFALNVLAEGQEDLSRQFAAEVSDRFAGIAHTIDGSGLPLLDGAAAHILCKTQGAHAAGDHTIFLGLVIGGACFPRPPLLHFRGAYHRLL
jgi:flavin reductase (DIM6/NTAB) family NADH-FMN oxidoreductase RutF